VFGKKDDECSMSPLNPPKSDTDRQTESIKNHFHLNLASLWDVIWDAVDNFRNNGDVNQAAAIALYAILSIIPLFILTILLAGNIFGTNHEIQKELVEGIQKFHPYFSGDLLKQLGQIEHKKQVLGWVGIFSLIWFSSMIFGAIETALNIIFRSRKTRNYFVSKLLALSMIPMGWTIGIASVAVTYMATLVAKQPLPENMVYLQVFLFRYILPYLVMVLFFTIVYKVIPTEKISFGHAFVGSAIFSALMEIAKHFFTWYVSNYTRYNVIYGSLETVVILVIWVFYMALILLFCAELISSFRRRDLVLLEKAFLKLKPQGNFLRVNERLFRKFGTMYPKDSYIFKEGDHGQEMFYILMGRVQVEKSAGATKKILAEMGPGSYFGEMAALIDVPRTASALAIEDSDIAIINSDTFHNLLRGSEGISLFMLKEFSNRIKHTSAALEELSQSWVKLIAILYFLKEWPFKAGQNPTEALREFTAKEPDEIQQVLRYLACQGILVMKGELVTDFISERAWDLLHHPVSQ
jgi:membrane protein